MDPVKSLGTFQVSVFRCHDHEGVTRRQLGEVQGRQRGRGDPPAPQRRRTSDQPDSLLELFQISVSAEGVFVEGDFAYVADYGFGVAVIDISDPASPRLTGKLDISTTGACRDISVCGAYGFAANGTEGIEIIDFIPSE